MPEYFIRANSFAAPIVSDESEHYVEAETPEAALESFAAGYSHPAGLYAAVVYRDHRSSVEKDATPLATWLCNHERVKLERTKDLGSYGYYGHGPGKFEIDGELIEVDNPKQGSVVQA